MNSLKTNFEVHIKHYKVVEITGDKTDDEILPLHDFSELQNLLSGVPMGIAFGLIYSFCFLIEKAERIFHTLNIMLVY